ncbi:MAG TPA: tRNA (5-methylaminomethyl-2-thiouridylate)-methyltransferase [Candidatus Cloacimonadota bacterium]|nr:tRNA (5-methylaminomethyl-2-thiouridylate)-methyltransferase [Candidatus Cloacimonadota bacterium]
MRTRKAIALFSGGLDSILTVKFMQKLGYTVYPVFFNAPYFPTNKAVISARDNGIELILRDITEEHFAMVMNPKFGYGKNINPCIDCHAMMINLAGRMMEELNADFIITGEVIGQRPMSQRRDSLAVVANHSGFGDLLVRPLCQKCLPDTLPIRLGWVDKQEMLNFNGRSRKPQMDMAAEYGITSFPAPGGGCSLTDVNYTLRLRELIKYEHDTGMDLSLLKYGRHYRLSPKHKLIIGRDERENDTLWESFPESLFLRSDEFSGPLGLISGADPSPKIIELAASILLTYITKAPDVSPVIFGIGDMLDRTLEARKASGEVLRALMITQPQE